MKTFVSDISKLEFPIKEKIQGSTIRESIMKLIQKDYPEFSHASLIANSELMVYREHYISSLFKEESGEYASLRKNVLKSLNDQSLITENAEQEEGDLNLGQRISDKVATFGGSWTFIISFGLFLLFWIVLNTIILRAEKFDPFPFILLNLILSTIAALQAPVIMMSQNRQEEKDRERSKKDYMINLKSELEIRILHEKIDHVIMHQHKELIELQKIQIELLTDIQNNRR
jgi:uncharacterized membrane protein